MSSAPGSTTARSGPSGLDLDAAPGPGGVDQTSLGSRVQSPIQRLLDVARQHLGMEVAWFSEFRGDAQVIRAVSGDGERLGGVHVGDVFPMANSYCELVLRGELPSQVPDARRNLVTRDLPGTRDMNIGSYVGRPIPGKDGRSAGMVCCLSSDPAPELDAKSSELLGALIEMLQDEELPDWDDASGKERKLLRVHEAIQDGGMHAVFQPVVRLVDGAVVGYEALTRFRHTPDPALGFREAADVGLGAELELAAVRLAMSGRDRLPTGTWLSLNLSPATLLSPRCHRLLAQQPDPDRLVVEITEHAPVTEYVALLARTRGLSELGIRIAIDDAGAGFSSLRHILRLSPHLIKLDIEITRDIHLDPVRRALAQALVAFADNTGATLLAEGIERREEAGALIELGVKLGQGYLFGVPAPLPA
jgi:EAL domain-containing protein (putative c-di-GMP-specific phosphodiesterase class I)